MSFLKAMQERYTTKKYNPNKEISDSDIGALKEILRLTPSSINSQPWKFTFVSDQATKEKLSEHSKINTDKVLNCDTVIILSRIDDLSLFEKQLKEELPQRALDYYEDTKKSMSEEQTKAWFDKQVYIALGVLLSACATMKIDSTPMEGIEPDMYDKIIGHTSYKTLVAVTIGRRAEDDKNQPSVSPKLRIALHKIVESI